MIVSYTVPEGSTRPAWLYVGASVVEYRYNSGWMHIPEIKRGHVARFTKTRVVLEDNSWYPLRELRRYGAGSYDPYWELRAPDDPEIQRALVEIKRHNLAIRATNKFRNWERKEDIPTAETAIKALEEWLAYIKDHETS